MPCRNISLYFNVLKVYGWALTIFPTKPHLKTCSKLFMARLGSLTKSLKMHFNQHLEWI